MNDYIQQALRTESTDLVELRQPRLTHAAIGIMTEAVELSLAGYHNDLVNIKEEIGDILWYVAIACDEMECTMDELRQIADVDARMIDAEAGVLLSTNAADLLDIIKKNIFYGKDVDLVAAGRKIGNILLIIDRFAGNFHWTLDAIMALNIEKLRTRYPEKFTAEAAEDRDLAAEREVLEQ